MVGNVVGQGVGNITGAQKGFNWSGVAISGLGAAAGAAVSDKLELSNYKDGLGAIGTKFGDDLGRAVIDAGAFALTQLVIRGGKVSWVQVATDTVNNLIQNRAESNAKETRIQKWLNELTQKQKDIYSKANFIGTTYVVNISETDQARINNDRETLQNVFGENSEASKAEIENGKSLLHRYGYRVGALEDELAGMSLTVDQKASLLRGDGDVALKYAKRSTTNFLNNDNIQLNERYAIFSEKAGGSITRIEEGGQPRVIKFNFSPSSTKLADAVGVSFEEARAKTSWDVYKSVIDPAFNTDGVNSIDFEGLWRPTVGFFKNYFKDSQDAKFDGKSVNQRQDMAVREVRFAGINVKNGKYSWSPQHTRGNAIDIASVNNIRVKNDGWVNGQPKVAASEIISGYIDSLSAQQPTSLLTPWRMYNSKGELIDINERHYNTNAGKTQDERNHGNHIHFGL